MRYCSNPMCASRIWLAECAGSFCPECGQDMTPCIRCLCGKTYYNPRTPEFMPKFCPHCGKAFTEAYLGQCMAAQLKGLVGQITEKASDNV